MATYFKGITSIEDIKRKYKELAKALHPDMGGSHAMFVDMKQEYDYIIKYGVAPKPTSSASKNRPTPRYTPEEEEALRWKGKVALDTDYQVIEQVFKTHVQANKSLEYVILDIYKLDDLALEHFKFLAYLLKTHSVAKVKVSESTMNTWYKNYLNIKRVEVILE